MIITFVCPSAPHPIGGVTALYEFANGLQRRGHHVHLLHCPFFRNRIDSLDELSWFRFEPGIEHHLVEADETDLPEADIFFGSAGHPHHGLPVVLVQGFEMLHLAFERQAFRTPCLKVCIASWLVDVGQRFGVPPEQCEVVAMGIDHDRFRMTTPLDERPLLVGMLHSTHPAKGWPVGREALERAHAEVPDMRALVFGTAAPDEPLPGWMTFVLNPEPEQLVREIYDRCRIFVQSSEYEGFGFTAVEAMACGAALVTTDNGGSRDYAFDGETALVSPPGQPAALAANLVALLRDDRRRQQVAEAGRRRVQRFHWDTAAADLEACLERYLADPARYQQPPGPEQVPDGHGEDPFALR